MSLSSRLATLEHDREAALEAALGRLCDAWPDTPPAHVAEVARLTGHTPEDVERVWREVRGGGAELWDAILGGRRERL
jgi:hypothetical protein